MKDRKGYILYLQTFFLKEYLPKRERDRKRETERETERQRETETETETGTCYVELFFQQTFYLLR